MAIGWRRSIRFGRPEVFLLWCLSAPMFLFFAILAWFHPVEANWPAPAYLAAAPAMAWALTGGVWFLRHRWVWTALASLVAGVMTLIIHIHALYPFLPVEPSRDPTRRLSGWEELANEVSIDAAALDASLAAEGYGLVSELRFYTGQSVIYHQPCKECLSQYDLWPMPESPARLFVIQPKKSSRVPWVCRHAQHHWQLDKDPTPGTAEPHAAKPHAAEPHAAKPHAAKSHAARQNDYRYWVCGGLAGH
jgi:hypothetical protein